MLLFFLNVSFLIVFFMTFVRMYLISLCMLHVTVILKIFSFMLFLNSELRPHSFSDHSELVTAAEPQVRAGVQVSWRTECFSCSSFFIWITAGAEIQCHTFTSPFQPWEQDPSKLFNSVKCKPSPLLNYLSHMSHAGCTHQGALQKEVSKHLSWLKVRVCSAWITFWGNGIQQI